MRAEPPAPGGDATPPLPVTASDLDPEELRDRLKTLIPIALLRSSRRASAWRRLRARDEREAEAALGSACSSFLGHCRDGDIDAATPEELAAELLRIACNRAQRERRKAEHMRDATRRGTVRGPDGQSAARDYQDCSSGPEQEVLDREMSAYLRDVIDSIKEGLRSRRDALAIVELYLEDMEGSQAAIASALAISQSTVSRRIAWFHARIRRMLEETGDGESRAARCPCSRPA